MHTLGLNSNELRELPESIGEMRGLARLLLDDNALSRALGGALGGALDDDAFRGVCALAIAMYPRCRTAARSGHDGGGLR